MIELVLVRHAKSDWGDPGLRDHDRPLNERGLRDAPVMAARLAATGWRPDRILSSTALRARTTAEAFGEELGLDVGLDRNLYGASAHTLWEAAAASGTTSVMLFAHNPGISQLAEALSDGDITHMPTCAVARFTWATDEWDVAASLEPVSSEQMTPRDR